MNKLTRTQAFRAYNRVMAGVHEKYEMALRLDSLFDAGEFSGPAIDREFDREWDEVSERTLARLGYTDSDMMEEELETTQILMCVGIAP